MDIKQTFLNLTSETYPHGHESELFKFLPNNLSKDEFGNLYLQIGDYPSTMFTSHLDTASYEKKKVNHIIDNNIIKTDGTSILGADDKAGVTIMLYMIEKKMPGLYYFFLGEERGCIGSKKVAESHRKSPLPNIKKVVSFDRRGTDSVITFQSSQRCCSDSFANRLSEELNSKSKKESTVNITFDYEKDPTGIYTDSYQFISIYPECTNISVGYMNEHTSRETQDIIFLEKLCKTVVMINWEELPVERNPNQIEDEFYGTDRYYRQMSDMWNYDYKPKKQTTKKIWFMDDDYDKHVSYIEIDEKHNVIGMDLSQNRLNSETKKIKEEFDSVGIEYTRLNWDGLTLQVEYNEFQKSEHQRNELTKFISELNFWNKYIKEK